MRIKKVSKKIFPYLSNLFKKLEISYTHEELAEGCIQVCAQCTKSTWDSVYADAAAWMEKDEKGLPFPLVTKRTANDMVRLEKYGLINQECLVK